MLTFVAGLMLGGTLGIVIASAFILASRADDQQAAFRRGYDIGYTHAIEDDQ